MNCGMECIKYILFVVNFLFALGGLILVIFGILTYQGAEIHIQELSEANIVYPAVVMIAVGAVVFIVAFFGCCGAIRENNCMIVTFAVIILTVLVIQVGVAVYLYTHATEDMIRNTADKTTAEFVKRYYDPSDNKKSKTAMDTLQTALKCCGRTGARDYRDMNQPIPYSCCPVDDRNKETNNNCSENTGLYNHGCAQELSDSILNKAKMLKLPAIGLAAVELAVIIVTLCLASSIRNAERRGYKV